MSLLDLGMKLRHALVIERHLAAHQDIQNDTEAPYINFGSSVLLGLQQLWGSKVQTSTESLEVIPRRKKVAQPKVDDFDIAGFADENVLDLEITMDDAVAVAIVKGAGNLAGELAGLLLL
jgi:hypothetical protein